MQLPWVQLLSRKEVQDPFPRGVNQLVCHGLQSVVFVLITMVRHLSNENSCEEHENERL
jgi:hypothetical protein